VLREIARHAQAVVEAAFDLQELGVVQDGLSELASGDAKELMGPLAGTLAAISMGAVYMGALSYIGNAPNLMINAIASEQGVRMPSFFGYVLWAVCVLVPPRTAAAT